MATRTVTDITDTFGASITQSGDTSLAIINPRGEQASTITIPANQPNGTSATQLTAWAD